MYVHLNRKLLGATLCSRRSKIIIKIKHISVYNVHMFKRDDTSLQRYELSGCSLITAHSELWKILFLALSVTFLSV